MKQKVGLLTCGAVMIEFEKFAASISKYGTENSYDTLWYSTLENRRHNLGSANNRYNIVLNDKIHSLITQFFDEALPLGIGNFSPLMCLVFQKK